MKLTNLYYYITLKTCWFLFDADGFGLRGEYFLLNEFSQKSLSGF